jgi:hypothetical protein
MASITRRFNGSLTRPFPLLTNDTVAVETFASLATSRIVYKALPSTLKLNSLSS